ncbi:MAG: N-acetyltransferase family protein, partial [Planctomycetota bacterium]
MSDLRLTDLDAEPACELPALELFRAAQAGRNHAVCGEPSRMGLSPELTDLRQALGVLCAVEQDQVLGALAICPYSDEQVTLWGPVVAPAERRRGIGSELLRETRAAIRDGGFQSLRVLVDERNRIARAFCLAHGLSPWKHDLVFEHSLGRTPHEMVAGVCLARSEDLDEVARLLRQGFPESSYCDAPLAQRERQGYRHYLYQESGAILAAATVRTQTARNWLNMLTVAPD